MGAGSRDFGCCEPAFLNQHSSLLESFHQNQQPLSVVPLAFDFAHPTRKGALFDCHYVSMTKTLDFESDEPIPADTVLDGRNDFRIQRNREMKGADYP